MWIFPDYGTGCKTQLRHNNVHYGMFVMTIQADAVRKMDGSPTVVLVGPAGRGKTTALQLAMVCAGNFRGLSWVLLQNAKMKKAEEAVLQQKLSSLHKLRNRLLQIIMR
ncbi:unnamed protein product [Porites evermanni]|uniref:DNA2/NAM7 helicase helicase domain-containing protein n=1 Tax=Porites evermanni TaxID=104178 RepID=A0ABN8ME13_9CNID|nr:unnamed protein product [Porites evermanni]